MTFDYPTGDPYPLNAKCGCGSKNCRKKITGNEWKDPDFQKKYARHFSPYIQGLIDKSKKMTIKIQKILNKNLIKEEKELINNARNKEWGKPEIKDFNKDYEPNNLWFFVKDNNKIVSFGCLRPIKIKYLKKDYNILGICSILSLEKGKGYGTILINSMINSSKKTSKTFLGFTTQTEFFKKAGLKTKKDFIKRFIYKKPNGEEIIDNESDGIYYEGKDKIISKILKTKSPVYIEVLHW